MKLNLLDLLRCPFCGGTLSPVQNEQLEITDKTMRYGILSCYCCTFPVVDGIPVMQTDHLADAASQALAQGNQEQALRAMLELDETQHDAFRAYLAKGAAATYSEGIALLNGNAEGTYFLYRFSDPTYLASQAVVRVVGQNIGNARVLDLCGGSGHLTRTMCQLSANVVLADAGFGKLWLAQRITAPTAEMVCCDANSPLPFAAESFGLVVCSDAFHYIWSKRLLACEMMRLAGVQGTVLLPHVHNATGANYSAGMPLLPAHYRSLFAQVRVLRESTIFAQFIAGEPIDLSREEADEALTEEAALVLIASRQAELFRPYAPLPAQTHNGELRINPLYRVTEAGEQLQLELAFPSELYAEEYAASLRYLPQHLTLNKIELHAGNETLLRQFVLLDVPKGYC